MNNEQQNIFEIMKAIYFEVDFNQLKFYLSKEIEQSR